jgi:hypothetical protein
MSFDELSRELATTPTRRGVLKMIGAALGAAVAATILRPVRGDALVPCKPGLAPCGPEGCCAPGATCLNPSTGRCGCDPAGNISCGQGCCKKGETCSDTATVTCCCSGTTPCGTSCCKGGVACINRSKGLCGCPSGTTVCGTGATMRCCPAGQTCSSEQCQPATSPGEPGTGPGYATPCSAAACTPCCSSVGCPNAGDICVNGCCRRGPTCSCAGGFDVCTSGPGFTCGNGQYCAKRFNSQEYHCANCTPCGSGNTCPQGQFCNSVGCCVCFDGG